MTNVEFYLKDLESRMKGIKGEEYYVDLFITDDEVSYPDLLIEYIIQHRLKDSKITLYYLTVDDINDIFLGFRSASDLFDLSKKHIQIGHMDSSYIIMNKVTSCLQADGTFCPFYDVTEEWIAEVVAELTEKGEIKEDGK